MSLTELLRWISAGGFGVLSGALTCVLVPGCGLALLAIFGWSLYTRSRQMRAEQEQAQQWPSTTGVVLRSQVEVSRTGRSRHVYPRVLYQYTVDGRTYQGQRIRAGDQFLSVQTSGDAEQTIARYPAGARVSVYFDPVNPAESALER